MQFLAHVKELICNDYMLTYKSSGPVVIRPIYLYLLIRIYDWIDEYDDAEQ